MKEITIERIGAIAAAETSPPNFGWTLTSLSFPMLLSSLDSSVANVALPTLTRAFTASLPQAQWVVLANLLALTTLIVGVGRLGDLIGRRRLLLAGIYLFTGASALSGFAPTLGLLIAARAAQGIGGAIMMALSMALVGETVPKEKTGRAMGLLGTMSAFGTALGPSLGGLLISGFGWRVIFLIHVPLGILAFTLARHHLPVDRQDPKKIDRIRFDHAGTVLLALTLAAYALGVTTGRGDFGVLNAALLAFAALGLGLFVHVEKRTVSPLIALGLFRNLSLSASLVVSALVATVVTTTLVVGPFYLSRALGLDAAGVGFVLSVGPLVAGLIAVPAGRLTDRFGAQRTGHAGLFAIGTGAILLSMLPTTYGLVGFVAPIVLITAGYGLFQTANNTGVMAETLADQRGKHLRPAQLVAKSRAHHRRLRHGSRLHVRFGDEQHFLSDIRGDRHGDADHVRSGRASDHGCARDLGWQTRLRAIASGLLRRSENYRQLKSSTNSETSTACARNTTPLPRSTDLSRLKTTRSSGCSRSAISAIRATLSSSRK